MNSSRHSGACTTHDHPFAGAPLEEIHPNKPTARVFSVPKPLYGDTAIRHGDIAEHLHVYRTILKGLEFVMEGSKSV
jgi:hypothetical protein